MQEHTNIDSFRSVEGDLHIVQECLALSKDKKIIPGISSYAECVQNTIRNTAEKSNFIDPIT